MIAFEVLEGGRSNYRRGGRSLWGFGRSVIAVGKKESIALQTLCDRG